MQRKNRSGRWTVSPTGHKKWGGIQGISAASAARAETLSDALGTRLNLSVSGGGYLAVLKSHHVPRMMIGVMAVVVVGCRCFLDFLLETELNGLLHLVCRYLPEG